MKIKEDIKIRKQKLIQQKMEEAERDKTKKVEINQGMQLDPKVIEKLTPIPLVGTL